MTSNNWKLSPSDFAFLWEECRRCFYLKVARNFNRPRAPFPRVFGVIDRLINNHFNGAPSKQISELLPEGFVKYGESWVQSKPLHVTGRSSTCYIRGRFDSVLEFTDGGYGIIDFKTTIISLDKAENYRYQLEAYAQIFSNPGATKIPSKFVPPGNYNYSYANSILLGLIASHKGGKDLNAIYQETFFEPLGIIGGL